MTYILNGCYNYTCAGSSMYSYILPTGHGLDDFSEIVTGSYTSIYVSLYTEYQ